MILKRVTEDNKAIQEIKTTDKDENVGKKKKKTEKLLKRTALSNNTFCYDANVLYLCCSIQWCSWYNTRN